MKHDEAHEFAKNQGHLLASARACLAELAAGREPDVSAGIQRLYTTLGLLMDGSAGWGPEWELVSGVRTLVDRVREHRVPLSKEVLDLLLEAVSFLAEASVGAPAAGQVLAGLTTALSDLNSAGQSGRTDWELFVDDAREQLEACAQALRRLDGAPERDLSHIHVAFRSLHTFKGNCGLMGLARLEAGARAAEDALVDLRSGDAVPTAQLCTALLSMLGSLERCLSAATDELPLDASQHELVSALKRARTLAKETRLGDLLVARKLVGPDQVEAALAWKRRPLGEVLVELQELSPEDLESTLHEQMSLRRAEPVVAARVGEGVPHARLVQVQASRLEQLLQLADELSDSVERELLRSRVRGGRLGELIGLVREASARVRLLPVARAFRRLELLVADFARKQGKTIELVLTGGDVEIERSALESLSAILLHTVRNAIDHGVEDGAERLRLGKPRTGRVAVDCAAEQGQLTVRIADDGRGLDRQRILSRAAEMGLPNAGPHASAERVLELIFVPGFSTARTVSDASGRGVGMDAVRSSVEALGGSLRLSSTSGVGTTVIIDLPLPVIHVPGEVDRDADDLGGQASGTWRTGPARQAR